MNDILTQKISVQQSKFIEHSVRDCWSQFMKKLFVTNLTYEGFVFGDRLR